MAGAAKYQPYPAYQSSYAVWSGDVPEHWTPIRLKHVFSEKKKRLNPSLPAGSISFGNVIFKNEDSLAKETKAAYQEVLEGEFLVNPLNMNFDLISLRTALSSIDVVVSTGYLVLQSHDGYNKNYLRWLLQQFDVAHMKTLGAGVRQTISFTDIGNSFIFEPPLPEQTIIAAFLDYETAKIDALIAKQQRLIALLEEKRQAVISRAVTKGLDSTAPLRPSGIDWLGDVPAHWEVVKLSYRYEVLLGKMLDQAKVSGNYLGHYLRNTDVQWGKINTSDLPQMDFRPDEIERYSVRRGDLIVCEGGEVGRCALWEKDEPCFFQKALHRLRPINPQRDSTVFFASSLTSSAKQGRFTGGINSATIAHLPAEAFRQYKFAFPPPNEQLVIAEFLEKQEAKYNRLDAATQSAITLLKERRTALISAAVTGKIDLRGWQAPAEAPDTTQDEEVLA